MKWRRWVITGALLALVLGTGAAYLATRESSRPKAKTETKSGAAQVAEVPLVDERPLPTARALAALAITPEEQRLAQEAARIADHEVDLALADALRQAAEQQPAQDPKSRDLYLKMQQAQTALTDVLSRVEQVKAKIATAKPADHPPARHPRPGPRPQKGREPRRALRVVLPGVERGKANPPPPNPGKKD